MRESAQRRDGAAHALTRIVVMWHGGSALDESQGRHQVAQHLLCAEVFVRDVMSCVAVILVVAADRLNGLHDVVRGVEGEETAPRGEDIAEACVLGDDRSACREERCASVAEPPGSWARIEI